MKKLIITAALSLLMATTAATADEKSSNKQDMVKDCHSMMKDGKMADDMSKDMMKKCHRMMDKMEEANKAPDTAGTDTKADHTKHHQ